MSTQELVYNLPKLKSRSLQRKLKFAKLKTKRFLKAKARKAKSKSITMYRRQYFLTAAQTDLKVAVSRNEDIFITSTIVAALVGYCFALNAADFLLLFFQTAYDAANITGISLFFLSLAAIGTLTILLGWIAAFMLNIQSLAIMEGVNGKQHKSVRSTLRNGLHNASRVATTWLILLTIMSAPLLLAAITGYTYVSVAAMSLKEIVALAPQAGILAAVMVLFVLLQYSLAPYVALFETDLSFRQVLARSRQLVKRRGRIFVLAVYLALAATLAGVYVLAVVVEHLIGMPKIIICSIGGLAAIMFTNGIFVMLYRKRKLARKN